MPKAEISEKKIIAPQDFACTVFTHAYDIYDPTNIYALLGFAQSDITHLKMACKVSDTRDIAPCDIVFFDTETTGLAGGAALLYKSTE